MNDDDKTAALDAANRYVRSGFYDADEIVEIIDESLFEPGTNRSGVARGRDRRRHGDLWLTFGDIGGDDAKGVAVGHRIAAAARSVGFQVDWPGSVTTRIRLHGINWQRRSAAP